ncbi:MAG: hypothetical protein GDA47_04595, partial [Rhodospirillales bacterium]|nr:hypothetical protein [Rhodospirillales bacterium]
CLFANEVYTKDRTLPEPPTDLWTGRRQSDDTPIMQSYGNEEANVVGAAVACQASLSRVLADLLTLGGRGLYEDEE